MVTDAPNDVYVRRRERFLKKAIQVKVMKRRQPKDEQVIEHLDNYFEQGLSLMETGDFAQAVAMFDSAIKLGLGNIADIYVCRGEALAYLGQWREAETSINEALRRQPYMAAAYNERGNVRRFQQDDENAIRDYTAAIQIEPTYYEAYYNRALAYEDQHRFAEAEADLTRTLELNSDILQAYEARGRVRASQRKFDQAIDDLTRYLRTGAGRQYDNHSEIQGHLLSLRLQRLFWSLFSRWRG